MFRKSARPDPRAMTLLLEADEELGYTLGSVALPSDGACRKTGSGRGETLPRRWLLREAIGFASTKSQALGCDVVVIDPDDLWDDDTVDLRH